MNSKIISIATYICFCSPSYEYIRQITIPGLRIFFKMYFKSCVFFFTKLLFSTIIILQCGHLQLQNRNIVNITMRLLKYRLHICLYKFPVIFIAGRPKAALLLLVLW